MILSSLSALWPFLFGAPVSALQRAWAGNILLCVATVALPVAGSETVDGNPGSADGEKSQALSVDAAAGDTAFGEQFLAEVVEIIDGGTVRLLSADGSVMQIRLKGVAAPAEDQPYGAASRLYLAALVAGKRVRVESVQYDSYGSLLGNIWVAPRDCPSCGETLYVNHAQILAGLAWCNPLDQAGLSEEDRGRFHSAEQEARRRNWGLWADPDATPP